MGAIKGRVYLIGAGPGSPDLLTLRGWRALREADLILCDDLLPRNFLEELALSATGKTIEWVGGAAGHLSQAEINERLARAARAGQVVARLKGGDPFVFGRGVEEIEFLAARGIDWEVIPGASSCTAAPTHAGLPLTCRESSRSFAVVTARIAGGRLNLSYPLADSLVVLMGAAVLAEVTRQLVSNGWRADGPAAVVERATLPWERRVYGTLSAIAERAAAEGLAFPAILIVGSAAQPVGDHGVRPRILFTGLDPSNFRGLGDLIHWPVLQMVRDEEGWRLWPCVLEDLNQRRFEWVVFTGRAGARSFSTALLEAGHDARCLAGMKIAALGAGTAGQLREGGWVADVIPRESGTVGLLRSLGRACGRGEVLIVQGSHLPHGVITGLESQEWRVTLLPLHRIAPHPDLGQPLPDHDVVYFVSPSGVRVFHDAYGEEGLRREAWCMGEMTLAELTKYGKNAKVVNPYDW